LDGYRRRAVGCQPEHFQAYGIVPAESRRFLQTMQPIADSLNKPAGPRFLDPRATGQFTLTRELGAA